MYKKHLKIAKESILTAKDFIMLREGEIVERGVFADGKDWQDKPYLVDYLKMQYEKFQAGFIAADCCEKCKHSTLGCFCRRKNFRIDRFNVCRGFEHSPDNYDDYMQESIKWGAKMYERYCREKKIKLGGII